MLGSFSYFPVYQHFPRCLLESSNWVLAFSQVLPGDSDYLLLILLWPQTVGLGSGQYYIWFKWHFQMTFPLLLCRNHSPLRLMSSSTPSSIPSYLCHFPTPWIYPFIWWGICHPDHYLYLHTSAIILDDPSNLLVFPFSTLLYFFNTTSTLPQSFTLKTTR